VIGSVQVTTVQLTFLPILYTAAKSRKSNCVKEVERLKKNRDERRQVHVYLEGFHHQKHCKGILHV